MNKIIIEDNIPLPKGTNKSKLDPRTLSLIKYRKDCIENMESMIVGQSFLIYDNYMFKIIYINLTKFHNP